MDINHDVLGSGRIMTVSTLRGTSFNHISCMGVTGMGRKVVTDSCMTIRTILGRALNMGSSRIDQGTVRG